MLGKIWVRAHLWSRTRDRASSRSRCEHPRSLLDQSFGDVSARGNQRQIKVSHFGF